MRQFSRSQRTRLIALIQRIRRLVFMVQINKTWSITIVWTLDIIRLPSYFLIKKTFCLPDHKRAPICILRFKDNVTRGKNVRLIMLFKYDCCGRPTSCFSLRCSSCCQRDSDLHQVLFRIHSCEVNTYNLIDHSNMAAMTRPVFGGTCSGYSCFNVTSLCLL